MRQEKNGDDALDFLTRESFDLVLLDIFMEGMDGFQVIENKINRKIDTPVIIMSGRSSTDTAVKALRMGAIDYLKKPFETQEMLTSVKNSLNRATLENKNKAAESQSAQSQKVESLRCMAGCIAHHFNNQLSVVTCLKPVVRPCLFSRPQPPTA
ncbi:MAG: response regulator [Desulfotignum sp.]